MVRTAPRSEVLERQTGIEIVERLTEAHGFSLDYSDRETLLQIHKSFCKQGPDIRWDPNAGAWAPTYHELMVQADTMGHQNSYLASENAYQIFREYENNNRIVPITGDFAGSKALPALGAYLREHHIRVAWFYVSNVEPYLKANLAMFASNVAKLPLADNAILIRSVFHRTGRDGTSPFYRTSTALEPIRDWLQRLPR